MSHRSILWGCVFLVLFTSVRLYGSTPRDKYSQLPTEQEVRESFKSRTGDHFCSLKGRTVEERAAALWLNSYPTANQYDYDVRWYNIDLEISFSSRFVDGYTDIQITSLVDGLSYVDLNFWDQLNVSNVTVDGVSQTFVHSSEILTVNLTDVIDEGEDLILRIYYSGYPQNTQDGMFFTNNSGQDVCQTSCEPFGSRNWYPCKDFPFDKADSCDVTVTYPTSYAGRNLDCGSAGLMVSDVNNGDGTTTTHWSEANPIATYLIAFVITDFVEDVQQWEYAPGQFMPVVNLYYPSLPPSDPSQISWQMLYTTIPALEAYSNYFGLYPFVDEKYGNMHCDFPGMEHQTLSCIGTYWSDEYVVIHELAHQWAGDQVTCETFNHVWLNEGIGTYFEFLYYEYYYGYELARDYLNIYKYFDVESVYVEDVANDPIFNYQSSYAKGAWVTFMLRNQMGDSLFFPAMQYYFFESEYAGKTATTEDFCSVMSQYYGSDLSWFFDAWIYQDGQPNYEYAYQYQEDLVNGGYDVDLVIDQNNDDGFFPMHVDMAVYAGTFDSAFTIWNGHDADYYQLDLPNPPDSILIDPDEEILRRVTQVPLTMHIVTTVLPEAVLDEPYSFTLKAIGGVPPYHWGKTLGQFPFGLLINTNTGEIYGTPTWPGTYAFRMRCNDSDDPQNVDERWCSLTVVEPSNPKGDCDGSGSVDIDDAVFLINYIFGGGPAPDPLDIGDVDCSGGADIDDVVYIIIYIFGGGPQPGDPDGDSVPDC